MLIMKQSRILIKQISTRKKYFNTPASTWMPLPWSALTSTFDLQNTVRSSVGVVTIVFMFHWDWSSHSRDIVVTRSVRGDNNKSWKFSNSCTMDRPIRAHFPKYLIFYNLQFPKTNPCTSKNLLNIHRFNFTAPLLSVLWRY